MKVRRIVACVEDGAPCVSNVGAWVGGNEANVKGFENKSVQCIEDCPIHSRELTNVSRMLFRRPQKRRMYRGSCALFSKRGECIEDRRPRRKWRILRVSGPSPSKSP